VLVKYGELSTAFVHLHWWLETSPGRIRDLVAERVNKKLDAALPPGEEVCSKFFPF
jgi:hypothetical protein